MWLKIMFRLLNCSNFEIDLNNVISQPIFCYFVEQMYTFTVRTINDALDNTSEPSQQLICTTKAGGGIKLFYTVNLVYHLILCCIVFMVTCVTSMNSWMHGCDIHETYCTNRPNLTESRPQHNSRSAFCVCLGFLSGLLWLRADPRQTQSGHRKQTSIIEADSDRYCKKIKRLHIYKGGEGFTGGK